MGMAETFAAREAGASLIKTLDATVIAYAQAMIDSGSFEFRRGRFEFRGKQESLPQKPEMSKLLERRFRQCFYKGEYTIPFYVHTYQNEIVDALGYEPENVSSLSAAELLGWLVRVCGGLWD